MTEAMRQPMDRGPAKARRPLSIVAVTQDDPFFTGRFFRAFLDALDPERARLTEVVLLRNFNEPRMALARRLWRFYGTVGMVRLLGRYAATRIAELTGRPRTVRALARKAGVPVRELESINDDAYLDSLEGRQVDVLLSVAAPQIFRDRALNAAPRVLNVHNGRLPDYRGMMPTFWALRRGEEAVTVTLHEMAAKLDAGGVLAEFPVPVRDEDTAFSLSARAKVVAGREIARWFAEVARSGRWPESRPIRVADGQYFKFPTRSDARSLRDGGRRLL